MSKMDQQKTIIEKKLKIHQLTRELQEAEWELQELSEQHLAGNSTATTSVIKRFRIDYGQSCWPDEQMVLPISYLVDGFVLPKHLVHDRVHSCINESGWFISGQLTANQYVWCGKFKAVHATYGTIKGKLIDCVTCDSDEAWANFIRNHPLKLHSLVDI